MSLESTTRENIIFYTDFIFKFIVIMRFQLSDIHVILVYKRLIGKYSYLCFYFNLLFITCMEHRNWCNINNHPQSCISYYFIIWEYKGQIQRYFQMNNVVLIIIHLAWVGLHICIVWLFWLIRDMYVKYDWFTNNCVFNTW
jgi:hypothetical protein